MAKKIPEGLSPDITILQSLDLKALGKKHQINPNRAPKTLEVVKPVEIQEPPTEAVPETEQIPEVAPVTVGEEPPTEPPIEPPTAPAKKKGLWKRFKDAVFNRETGKIAGKMSYDSLTSLIGIKLATDMAYGLYGKFTGEGAKGDFAKWLQESKEAKSTRDVLTKAYEEIMESLDKVKGNKALEEYEKLENRIDNFKAKVESAKILPDVKAALLDRVAKIVDKHHDDAGSARKERDRELRRVLDAYLLDKSSAMRMKVAKDAANLGLMLSGFSLLRGVAYAGASILERGGKAMKSYVKQEDDKEKPKSKVEFVAKEFATSAVKTAHALVGQVGKKDVSGRTRTIEGIQAWGIVLRGAGIGHLAFGAGSGSTGENVDRLINGFKEGKLFGVAKGNFFQNLDRVEHMPGRALHAITHPTEVFQSHKVSLAIEPEEHPEMPIAPEPPPIPEHHEVPVPIEPITHGDHSVAVEVLNNREGILSGVNKIIHGHPDVFVHDDGKAWTANEIHLWKVHELKEMGFKYEGGKWGHPMTVHGGAEVEVYVKDGQPHFKLASDEHVTFNKNYKWVDVGHKEHLKIVDTGAVAGRKGDYLINPFPEDHGVGHAPELNIVDTAPSANVDVMSESATSHARVKVNANIKEMAVVHHVPKESVAVSPAKTVSVDGTKGSVAAPEKIVDAPEVKTEEGTLDQILTEQNSKYDRKEFFDTFQEMRGSFKDHVQNSLILKEPHDTKPGTPNFWQKRLDVLHERQQHYDAPLDNNGKLNDVDKEQVKQLLRAEALYKKHKSGWEDAMAKSVFNEDDYKVVQLALAPHPNPDLHPILVNNSHAVLVWDKNDKKYIFYYNESSIYNLDEDGNLIEDNTSGHYVIAKEEVFGKFE